MTPAQFIAKWQHSPLSERAGAQPFFLDLRAMLGVPYPRRPRQLLLRARRHAQLQLDVVLVTHHHADHQGGVAELIERWHPRVFGPDQESITGCSDPLSGGEKITVRGQTVEVLPVGGHTRGHIAYHVPGAVFCGDTLFGAGCGRLFEGTPAQMCASLARLAALPDETKIYCAHEYTETNLRFALAVEPQNAALRERAERVVRMRAAGLPTIPSTLREEKANCHQ